MLQRFFLFLAAYSGLVTGKIYASDPQTLPDERPSVREFAPGTIAALGREIYRHDQLAWHGTDALMASLTDEQRQASGFRGWIVDVTGDIPLVRFIRETDDALEAGFDIHFPTGQTPQVSEPNHRTLSPHQLKQYTSRVAAMDALMAGNHPWCGGRPNYVVLPDPDGLRFLVYILRPKTHPHLVPIGGHYRITVADDGTSVEQVDQLSASCLSMDRQSVSDEGELVALGMSHIVSSTPVETHVFLSLQEKLPFSVITPDGVMWMVENGEIRVMNQSLKDTGEND